MRLELFESALTYARAGYNVMPLHWIHDGQCTCGRENCKSPGKHPRTAHGAHDATTNETVIRAWWARWPDASIGMTLDALVVVDIDPRNGGSVSALLEFPSTCVAKTGGGGWHYLFKAVPDSIYPGKYGPGVDIKTGGGAYIVVAPSVHASGAEYQWVAGMSPMEINPAPAPDWLSRMAIVPKAPRTTQPRLVSNIRRPQRAVAIQPDMLGWRKVSPTCYERVYRGLAEEALKVFNGVTTGPRGTRESGARQSAETRRRTP